MEISNIIYYSRQDKKNKTLSLYNLSLRGHYECELKTIFNVARISVDSKDLLKNFQNICDEHIELHYETPYYIRFLVSDAYGNTNYLKFQKSKDTISIGEMIE